MPSDAILKKLAALREKLRHHEYRYYVLDQPEVTDAEFDKLMNELKKLEALAPPPVAAPVEPVEAGPGAVSPVVPAVSAVPAPAAPGPAAGP